MKKFVKFEFSIYEANNNAVVDITLRPRACLTVSHFEYMPCQPRAIWPATGKHDVIHKTGST